MYLPMEGNTDPGRSTPSQDSSTAEASTCPGHIACSLPVLASAAGTGAVGIGTQPGWTGMGGLALAAGENLTSAPAPDSCYPQAAFGYWRPELYLGPSANLAPLAPLAGGPQLQEARQSLPPEGLDGEPGDGGVVYVNVRQHHAILRRRRQRAKAEAENKALRVRKQYLHESRHEQAVKRVRGPGGRFLTAVEKEAAGTGGTSNEASYDQRK